MNKVNHIGECDFVVPSAACLQTLVVFEDNNFELILFQYNLFLYKKNQRDATWQYVY